MTISADAEKLKDRLDAVFQALVDSGRDVGEEPAFDRAMQELEDICDAAENLNRDIIQFDNLLGDLYRKI